MMSCTCRATPLKIFVQGLSQVHKLEASPSFVRLPIRTRPALQQNYFAFARQARSLHYSNKLSQDSSEAAAKETEAVIENSTQGKDETTQVKEEYFASVEAPDTWKAQPSNTEKYRKRKDNTRDTEGRTTYSRGEKEPNAAGAWDKAAEFKKPRIKGPSSNQPQSGAAYWKAQKAALKEKFPEGWRPKKRLSPDALAGIRALNAQFPEVYTTQALAEKFQMDPEAIRRILKSKWVPNAVEEEDRQERWFRRGKSVWETRAAMGIKPPQKWRQEGIARDPSYHDWKQEAVERNRTQAEKDDWEIERSYRPRPKRNSDSERPSQRPPKPWIQRGHQGTRPKPSYGPRPKGSSGPQSGRGDS